MTFPRIHPCILATGLALISTTLALAQKPTALLQDANTIGIFRQQSNGYTVWYVDSAEQHQFESTDLVYWFGLNGDQPILGDWQETGHLQTGIFRNGYWYVDYNDNHLWDSGDQVYSFGLQGDVAVVGDWDHTGKLRIGVYRIDSSSGLGYWYVDTLGCSDNGGQGCNFNSNYYSVFQFGAQGDIPVVGDWDHTGVLRIGVFRPSTGQWIVNLKTDCSNGIPDCNGYWTGNPQTYYFAPFGSAGQPITGIWTGGASGPLSLGAFNRNSGQWTVDSNNNNQWDGGDATFSYGLSGDVAVMEPVPPFTISGQVVSGGAALSGVTVNLTGTTAAGSPVSASTTTDSNGDYLFGVLAGGNYMIGASNANGDTFGPPLQTFNAVSASQTANFLDNGTAPGGAGGNDITGIWQQSSRFAGSWSLTQSGNSVTGTVSSTTGASCGTITWQVTGQMLNSTQGTYYLTGSNPSAPSDSCGNESAVKQIEYVTLASGNQMASSIDTSDFSTGPVTGASAWTKAAMPSPATISGSPGIPYGGSSSYLVTVGSSPVTVTISTTAGAGDAFFLNNAYTSITLDQTTALNVYGDAVSSTAGNILISVALASNPSAVVSELRATVISVSLDLRNSGNWSPDNTAATPAFQNQYATTLGPHIVSPITGAYCAQVLEYVGTVTPVNYQGTVVMWRTANTAEFDGQTQYRTYSGPDASPVGNTVAIPTAYGHVFDADAPGQSPDLTDPNAIWRSRQNFTEFALLDHAPTQGSSAVELAQLQVYARTSCTGTPSSPQFATDLSLDNTSGKGTTPLTWNFQ